MDRVQAGKILSFIFSVRFSAKTVKQCASLGKSFSVMVVLRGWGKARKGEESETYARSHRREKRRIMSDAFARPTQ